MKFTKLTSLVSAVLMLAGTGSIVTSALSAQTVRADNIPTVHGKYNDIEQEFRFPRNEFMNTVKDYWHIRTVPYNLNGHNDIKFHWWKKPHFKMAYGSVNQLMDQNDDAAAQGAGLNTVNSYYIGTVTINGEKRYISPCPDLNDTVRKRTGDHVTLPTYDFDKPAELRHTTKGLDAYLPTVEKNHITLQISQDQFDKNDTVVVYKDSKPLRFSVPGYGSMTMIPVTYVTNGGNGLTMLDYNDFKKYTKRGAKHQRSIDTYVHFTLNGQTLSHFNFTKPTKFRNGSWGNSDALTYKAANKYLHSAKWRKAIAKKNIEYLKFFAKQVRDQGYIG